MSTLIDRNISVHIMLRKTPFRAFRTSDVVNSRSQSTLSINAISKS